MPIRMIPNRAKKFEVHTKILRKPCKNMDFLYRFVYVTDMAPMKKMITTIGSC